ncbi:MAG: rod shape determining protein RodA [Bacteroidetes bacterium]|nr:MAG: rod shape determining protein RodA [Bacteroidota bacterium]
MRERSDSIFANIDWFTVVLYLVLVCIGWSNIYAAVYDEEKSSLFNFNSQPGRQMIFIGVALFLSLVILIVDASFYTATAYFIFGGIILLNIAVIFLGDDVKGSHSWFKFGSFSFQPAEFAKFATGLMLAKLLTEFEGQAKWVERLVFGILVVLLPVALCLLQSETGVSLVFFALILVFYREGLIPGWLLLLGMIVTLMALLAIKFNIEGPRLAFFICVGGGAAVAFLLTWRARLSWVFGVIFTVCMLALGLAGWKISGEILLYSVLVLAAGVSCFLAIRMRMFIFNSLVIACFVAGSVYLAPYGFLKLKPHQQDRLRVFLRLDASAEAKKKELYNLNQSMIAIGSGGLTGKGYLQGTQTKYDFVPEQETDFIFCTVGEEWGFVGTSVVLILFAILIIRIVFMSERQRSPFSRIYGYAVASIFFFHLIINVGMTMGMVPVIGIPLPFFSYGGSSLIAFTILLFIFIRLDSERLYILR